MPRPSLAAIARAPSWGGEGPVAIERRFVALSPLFLCGAAGQEGVANLKQCHVEVRLLGKNIGELRWNSYRTREKERALRPVGSVAAFVAHSVSSRPPPS
jgi:hypothetical protein